MGVQTRGRRCEFNPRLLQWKPPVFPRSTVAGVRDRRGRPPGGGPRKKSEEDVGDHKRKRDDMRDV